MEDVVLWYCEMGLTPSSRTRLPASVDLEVSKLERILEGEDNSE